METHRLLQLTLERVVARVGDPAPRVYQRLFERSPELLPMFVGDARGSVRAEMFLRAIDTLTDLAGERPYAAGMVASEWSNHHMNGVTTRQFESFFEIIVEVCQQALGDDWTPEIDAAWRNTLRRVAGVTARASAGG